MKFKILDLFCGAGGFSAGLDKNKNFETLIGLDFDEQAIKTFGLNFPTAEAICGDITNKEIKEKIISLSVSKGINMIVGGPPCQGFSLKGKLLGLDDPRNFLFLEYIEMLKAIQPEVFVIENVRNILSSNNGFFLQQILERTRQLGYIVNYGFLNARDFGVPQNRERAIIIGSKTKSIGLPTKCVKQFTTVWDAISDLSFLSSGEGEFEVDYPSAPLSDYQKKMRSNKLYNHIATKHSELALKKLMLIPPEGDKSFLPKELHGKQKFSSTWSRLEWNNISPTIDTRFDTPSNGKNSHPYLNRSITPREAARLQSFPDSFIFYGTKTAICKQIGNAVPPLIGKAIANKIDENYNDNFVWNSDYQLFNKDAFNFVNELINQKIQVDHIITDPPYVISKKNNFNTLKKPRKGVYFGQWDENFNLLDWIKDYSTILKPGGSFIVFCSYRFISYICDELSKNNIEIKDVLIWKKKNPMPRNTTRRYVQDMEFAIWAVKPGKKWIFNKDKSKPYMRSVFETPTVQGNERTIHPTQKSLSLMKSIIETHTNKNDLILDPFMGSGSTGVAALLLDRKFIGIEKDNKFFKIAVDRCEGRK
ncbi:DNA (cytosine-5-)-methyltransferase [Ureaplasma canigenitalium]|uniref:DNA (cytosine-5-)-methyltransferase n=1 Tax=Ureaplasma canigenitalium TaxID=42092 RepID=UPI0009FFB835|nr:DNA (cytosine-5-)-methyltransferase [Ureaplasma canigenitalium]